jgi:putative Holliday junction resolvase
MKRRAESAEGFDKNASLGLEGRECKGVFRSASRGPSLLPLYITQRSKNMRALGIDFGERRIGLALSDPTGTIASPLPTLKRRRGKRPPFAAIEELAKEHGVATLVVGLPLSLDGEDSAWTKEVREMGKKLSERTGLPVHFLDERFTSVRAEKALRAIGLPKHKREEKARVDAAAAVLILQAWLDRRAPAPGERRA